MIINRRKDDLKHRCRPLGDLSPSRGLGSTSLGFRAHRYVPSLKARNHPNPKPKSQTRKDQPGTCKPNYRLIVELSTQKPFVEFKKKTCYFEDPLYSPRQNLNAQCTLNPKPETLNRNLALKKVVLNCTRPLRAVSAQIPYLGFLHDSPRTQKPQVQS